MSTVAVEPLLIPNHSATSGQLPVELSPQEYGFAFIKSGFEDVGPDLASNFKDYGIDVVRACSVVLGPAVVDYIYRDSRQQPFYQAMYRYLVSHPVIAMALYGACQNTQDTLDDLKKGKNGRPCLREKYAPECVPIPEPEIEMWWRGEHPNQDEVTIQLTQRNVFHAADSTDEAIESLRLLGEHNPEFWATAQLADPRVEKLARYLTSGQTVVVLP